MYIVHIKINMALAGSSIAGIVLGSIFGFVLLLFLLLVAFRFFNRRNTAGSDNIKQLQGKTVVITGKKGIFSKKYFELFFLVTDVFFEKALMTF